MTRSRIPVWVGGAIFAFAAVLWLRPIISHPEEILFWRNAAYSDLLVSHWPNAVFLNRALRLWNQIPLWNPSILSGYPFFADPLSGVWYPPMWIAALWPRAITFNLLFWLHLTWAGLGMWRLAQNEGLNDYAALLSGLVFVGIPKWVAHVGLGHISFVSAVSWTPWLLLAIRSALTADSMSRPVAMRRISMNGLLLALIFVADPRWLLPSGILAVLYALHVLGSMNMRADLRARAAVRWAGLTGLFALGAAAGFASALVTFVSRSTRTLIDPAAPDPLALRLEDLGRLITFRPEQPETLLFLGLGAVFLSMVGLIFSRRRPWFWSILVLLGVIISMGGNLPLLGGWLRALPGASLMRIPARWFFLTALGVAYLAGAGFEALITAPIRGGIFYRSILVFLLMGAGVYLLASSEPGSMDQTMLLLVPAAAFVPVIFFRRFGLIQPRSFLVAAFAILTIEFVVVDYILLEARPVPPGAAEAGGLLQAVEHPYGSARTFSPSYSVDQMSAALTGMELADGVHPLQSEAYWLYMARAIGFDAQQYSVTLPPFPSGDPQSVQEWSLDVGALGRLNIQNVVSAYPLDAEGLTLQSRQDGTYVYGIESARPRAWIEQGESQPGDWSPAALAYWSPNRIDLVAEGPGNLVLSELAYPGWKVSVDGEKAPILTVDGLLRGVHIDDGDHRVSFVYRPLHLFAGMALSAFTLLAALYLRVRR